jgi:hypothetical protein
MANQQIPSKEHPSALTSIKNLAAVLRDQGKYGLAGEMYRQALGLSDWAWADYWDQRVRTSSECRGRWGSLGRDTWVGGHIRIGRGTQRRFYGTQFKY